MSLQIIGRRIALAAAMALAAGASGCCCPRGYVLRGDWSIELNRIAWLDGKHADYAAGDSYGDGGYAGMDAGGCCGGGPGPFGPGYDDPAGPARFHPVPTNPAFTPRTPPPDGHEFEPVPAGPNPMPDLPESADDAMSMGWGRPPAAQSAPRPLARRIERASWMFAQDRGGQQPTAAPRRRIDTARWGNERY